MPELDGDLIWGLYYLMGHNRKEARAEYIKAFNQKPDARAIDDRLETIFRDQICDGDKTEIVVPGK